MALVVLGWLDCDNHIWLEGCEESFVCIVPALRSTYLLENGMLWTVMKRVELWQPSRRGGYYTFNFLFLCCSFAFVWAVSAERLGILLDYSRDTGVSWGNTSSVRISAGTLTVVLLQGVKQKCIILPQHKIHYTIEVCVRQFSNIDCVLWPFDFFRFCSVLLRVFTYSSILMWMYHCWWGEVVSNSYVASFYMSRGTS